MSSPDRTTEMTQDERADPDYAFFRIEGDNGLTYVRHLHDSAERADKFMFEITRNNYLAFGALLTFGTAGLFGISGLYGIMSNRAAIITFICIAIIAVSVGAAILSFFYHRYSSFLYAKAWVAEKAWLRGKRSDRLLEAIRLQNRAFKAVRRVENAPGSDGRGMWRTSFYFWANIVPGAAGAIIIIAVNSGLISLKP